MTINILTMELKKFIEHEVSDYATAQSSEGYSAVRVFEWELPFKNSRSQVKQDFPYIVLAPIHVKENAEEAIVDVHMSFGIYDKGNEIDGQVHQSGFTDLVNLMRFVQVRLQRQRVINNQFVLIDEYEMEIPEQQQPYPHYIGVALYKFNIQRIVDERMSEFLHG